MEKMERLKSNETILQQMEAYNFDDPIKVTLVLEDDGKDNVPSDSIEERLEKYFPCTSNINELQVKDTKAMKLVYFSNVFQNAVEYSFTMENKNKSTEVEKWTNVRSIQEINAESDISKAHSLKLLDNISQNLIEISKCYYYTLVTATDSRTKTAREAHYLNIKQNYFNYSFHMVDEILLPQENNGIFIEIYIKRTFALAHTQSWYYMSREYLLQLILDIIYWTKKKKQCLQNIGSNGNTVITDIDKGATESNSNNSRVTNRTINSNFQVSMSSQNRQMLIANKNSRRKVQNSSRNSRNNVEIHPIKRRKTNDSTNYFAAIEQFGSLEPTLTERSNITASFTHSLQNEGTITPVQNNNLNAETPNRILRTVSTDSGYISPDIGVSPEDQTEVQTSLSNTPSTSAVACQLPITVCKICSNVTRNVCLGCQRVNYCSIDCQKLDWPFHMNLCGNIVILVN